MSNFDQSRSFFVAGGTLRPDAPSYVSRPADEQLRQCIEKGELCYVLTTRQMGKSSMMARTAVELRLQGYHTVITDLTALGLAAENEWYYSFLDELDTQLPLDINLHIWWEQHSALTPVRRLTKFIEDVVCEEVEGRIVIFVDEIDSALNLDFADDFFAAIRSLYNRDRMLSIEGRLSFVLLGVAAPDDLIKNQSRTPFNVGTRIELNELTRQDAGVLLRGLPGGDPSILERIFYWTNGHPYLTQRIGAAIARSDAQIWDNAAVDRLVGTLFFADEAADQESNLQFVNRRMTASPNKAQLLTLYRDIYRGKRIPVLEQSPIQNELRLYGLIRNGEDGLLKIRNRIYKTVFDNAWIKENLPADPWRSAALIGAVVLLAIVAGLVYYWQQRPQSDEILARSYIADFQTTTNPTLRLGHLAGLLTLEGFTDDAVELFAGLSDEEQVALFENATPDLLPQVREVASAVYQTLYTDDIQGDMEETTRVLQAIVNALDPAEDAASRSLRDEIRIWLEARGHARAGEFAPAEITYELALSFNGSNPATRIERSQALAAQKKYQAAVADLAAVWQQGPPWDQSVVDIVQRDWPLHRAALDAPEAPGFIALLATPTVAVQMSLPPGQLAFTSDRDGNNEIYLMDSDGTNLARLTNDPANDYAPAWSSDGEWLAFTSDRDGHQEIYVMRADGSDVRKITRNDVHNCCATWSPDGTRLVYNGNSRDGDQDIYVINIDSSEVVNLNDFPGDDRNPDWSPDGSTIVFDARRDGQAEIYMMSPDGANQRRLTRLFSSQRGADWSPDGLFLAYHSNQLAVDDGTQGYEHIFVMNHDGTGQKQLTDGLANDTWADWHPGGGLIAFASDRDGNGEIYVMSSNGSELVRLTNHPANDTAPVWRPGQ